MNDVVTAVESYEDKMKRFIRCVLDGKSPGKVSAEDVPALRSCIGKYIQGVELLRNEHDDSVVVYLTEPFVTPAGIDFVRE